MSQYTTQAMRAVDKLMDRPALYPVFRVKTDQPLCAVTLDGGSSIENATKILDILRRLSVRCTFFLAGNSVEDAPDAARKIRDAGHEIGNHSFSHLDFRTLTEEGCLEELRRSEETLLRVLDCRPELFRFPYGEFSAQSIRVVKRKGYLPIQWSVNPADWQNLSSDEIVQRAQGKFHPGSILLLHINGKRILETLPRILEQIRISGFTPCTVSELLLPREVEPFVDITGTQKAGRDRKTVPAQG